MEKDPGRLTAILAIIVGIAGAILTIIEKISLFTLEVLFILTTCALVLTFLSDNIRKTKDNEKEIEKLKDKFITTDRLRKLELKVFKK